MYGPGSRKWLKARRRSNQVREERRIGRASAQHSAGSRRDPDLIERLRPAMAASLFAMTMLTRRAFRTFKSQEKGGGGA